MLRVLTRLPRAMSSRPGSSPPSRSENTSTSEESNQDQDMTPKAAELRNELVDAYLNLETLDTNLFRAKNLMGGMTTTPWVYGGQVIGQGLVAAAKTVDTKFHPHSLHSYFIKAGDKKKPILYMVDPVRNGRSFCTRFVKAIQNGETICTIELSFHKEEEDSIVHQWKLPDVPMPEELEDGDVLMQRIIDHPDTSPETKALTTARLVNYPSTFRVRPVDPDAYLRVKSTAPRLMLWVRSKGPIGEDWRLNHCVAAFISDSSMIGTALLPHVAAGFKIGMVFSLDHSIWIHRHNFRIDDWMLYETESPIACGGRAMIHGKLWDRTGKLVLSTAQEGLVRAKL